ncbi:MAG: lyase family protein [Solirubrobacteraceae bacterium]
MTSELFAALYARGGAAAELSDSAWVRAMLDVEAALARACAQEGLIPPQSAAEPEAACAAGNVEISALRDSVASSATPVIAVVRALRERVPEPMREHVHLGATSQDIVDTALMLLARRSLVAVLDDAAGCADAAAALADAHRDTPMVGRTLLQQALPTTFGLRAAGWLDGLDGARRHLAYVRDHELAVQMGGPVGARAPGVARRVAADLGLAEPVLAWHAIRLRPIALACALGGLCGVLAKIARDVTLLAQQEVGECREGGGPDRGGSSAMAHKRNPVAAVSVLACAKRAPALVGTALACMEQEHERAAGAWQAEWGTHVELLRLCGSATAWTRDLLEGLEVDRDRMRSNLAAAGVGEAPPPAAGELVDRALEAHRAAR